MITMCHRTAAAAAAIGGTDRLADLLGADPSVVAGWINGEGRPDLASAISIIGLDEASQRLAESDHEELRPSWSVFDHTVPAQLCGSGRAVLLAENPGNSPTYRWQIGSPRTHASTPPETALPFR